MSYRCRVCGVWVPHNNTMRVHRVYRSVPGLKHNETRQEISREIPVCRLCDEDLQSVTLVELCRFRRMQLKQVQQEAVPIEATDGNEQRLIRKTTTVGRPTAK